MKPAFTCLYYLENSEHCILEIKRTDLPEHADLAEVFRWLVLTKHTQQVQQLTFRSMDSSGEVQERFFEQGYLKFNSQSGTYIEKFNSGQHPAGQQNRPGVTRRNHLHHRQLFERLMLDPIHLENEKLLIHSFSSRRFKPVRTAYQRYLCYPIR